MLLGMLVDMLSSPSFGNFRAAGHSDVSVLLLLLQNAVSSQLFGYIAVMACASTPDWSRLDWMSVPKVAVLLAITDIGFSLTHSLLHTVSALTKWHHFHHLCVTLS
jgi:sterol desaturase/sphingolipid hydroxylase (fatty acid hydroxylase superfamily)